MSYTDKQVEEMVGAAYREGYKNGARNFIGDGEDDLKKAAGQSWDIHKKWCLPASPQPPKQKGEE